MTAMIVLVASLATANPTLGPSAVAERLVFHGALRADAVPLLLENSDTGLRARIGDAVADVDAVADAPAVAVCGNDVAVGAHRGEDPVVIIARASAQPRLEVVALDAERSTAVIAWPVGNVCSFAVATVDGAVTRIVVAQKSAAARVQRIETGLVVPNPHEHPRGLLALALGDRVFVDDGLGQLASVDAAGHVALKAIDLGSRAQPEAVGAADGAWIVTTRGDLFHIDTAGADLVHVGAGTPTTAGPTPCSDGHRLAWPTTDGRVSIFDGDTVFDGPPLGSTANQPLLALDVEDDGAAPDLVAVLDDGRLVVIDELGDVSAVAGLGLRPAGPLVAFQLDADRPGVLQVRRGDGPSANFAFGLVPARRWAAVDHAVPAAGLMFSGGAIITWRGPTLPAAQTGSPSTSTSTASSQSSTSARFGCSAAPTAPFLLSLLVLGLRRRRRFQNETPENAHDGQTAHCLVSDRNPP